MGFRYPRWLRIVASKDGLLAPVALTTLLVAGCQQTTSTPVPGAAATATVPAGGPVSSTGGPASSSDKYALPQEATYTALLDFTDRIMKTDPVGEDAFAKRKDQKEQVQALATAASRMIALAPTEQQKAMAQEQFLGAHLILSLIGDQTDEAAVRKMIEDSQSALPESLKVKARKFMADQFLPRRMQESLKLLMEGGAQAADEVAETASRIAHVESPTALHANMLSEASNYLEMLGAPHQAKQVATLMLERFGNLPDERIAEFARENAGSALKRLDMLGKPLALQLKDLSGNTLDTSSLKGKVVLIDFWATYCMPCLEEMPNLRKVHSKYHDRGFEVVGVAMDREPGEVESYLQENPLPWFVAYSDDPAKRGVGQDPSARACNVEFLPTMFLLNQEGVVVALHPRGEKLEQEVAKLLP